MIQNAIIQAVSNRRDWQIKEPFLAYESADGLWTSIITGTGAVTVNDLGGIKILASAANDYAGVRSTNKLVDFPANTTGAGYNQYGVAFELRNDRDGTGTESGWFVGMTDTTTGTIADTTGLLVSSGSLFGFVLEKSTTVLKICYASAGTPTKVELSVGTTGVTAQAAALAANAIANTTGKVGSLLSVYVKQTGSTTVDVIWYIDGVAVYQVSGMDVTSFAAAYIEAFIKSTSTPDEIIYVDSLTAFGVRGDTTLVNA